MVICLERGASDLHMVQLMTQPLHLLLTDRHLFNSLLFQDNLGKPAPERLNQSGFSFAFSFACFDTVGWAS